MPKKKPARLGRPPVYGQRTRWLVHVPVDLAAKIDKWRRREKLSRAATVERALNELLEKR